MYWNFVMSSKTQKTDYIGNICIMLSTLEYVNCKKYAMQSGAITLGIWWITR